MPKASDTHPARLFLLLIILSGLSSITYELLWLRSLNLVLGSDSYALAVTLASFMAGLGFGSWVFGRLADRRSPLHVYRWLEFGIGAFALVSPALFTASALPYRFLFRHLYGHEGLFLASKFLIAFLALLLPTFLMGGTLPAAVRILTRAFKARGRTIALAYGLNTFGAAVAAIGVPFLLMPRMEMGTILHIAAAGNILVFLCTFFLPDPEPAAPAAKDPVRDGPAAPPGRLLHATFFISGFISLALETVWNRIFSIFFTSSIYTFSIVLILYLVPVALGALLATSRRIQALSAGKVYAWCQFGIATGILLNLLFLDQTAYLQIALLKAIPLGFPSYVCTACLVVGTFTAFINLLFGLSFPAALTYLTTSLHAMGTQTGRLAALNTAGTSLASLMVTFVLYRTLGSFFTLAALALLALANFVVLGARQSLRGTRILAATGVAAVALGALVLPWNLKDFHLLLCQQPELVLQTSRNGQLESYKKGFRILDFLEDKEAVVSISEDRHGDRTLYINGKPDASTLGNDLLTQYLLGHLPFLYRSPAGSPEVLVIGEGSGATTYAASCHAPKRLITVEISPDVTRVARSRFSEINHGVADRFPVIVDDGRNFLQNTDQKFDIIISEPSNPWITGISSLFTDQFFRTVKAHLKPGGIFCQWFHYYRMDFEQIKGIVITLRASLPCMNAFHTSGGDLFLVAGERELVLDPGALYSPPPDVRSFLEAIDIRPPESVLNLFLWDSAQIRALRSTYPPNRDARCWLEFKAPWFIFQDRTEQNLALLMETAADPRIPLNLSALSSGGRWNFREMDLFVGPYRGALPDVRDYGVVRNVFHIEDHIVINVFYSARLSWGDGESFTVLSPILSGPMIEKNIVSMLEAAKPLMPGCGPLTLNRDGMTYMGLADFSRPLRWLGMWNCPSAHRTYQLSLESARRIPDQEALGEFISTLTCRP